ncbi:MAG: flagellar basal body P-ring protein FlgI [Hyphomicrobiaceae bacterium]|uniref:flagellar basal body P-ring protein FlgI n=1 Tax=Pseudorhodoplanes sp. TaxID=1934341 RepID=UPI003D0CF2B9
MRAVWLALLGLTLLASGANAEVRIKDISSIREARSNQLIGYGLVAGLKSTGDTLRSAPFTDQSMTSMLERMGVNIRGLGARTRNVAAVMVTAELPAFAFPGNRIDVTVTSLGDASSLAGGTLIMTPLQAADGNVYAVGQGSVSVSGFEAKGQNEVLTHGVPTAGRIAGGAIVERASPSPGSSPSVLHLELKNPDFSTAVAILDAVNGYTQQHYGARLAQDSGPASVAVKLPQRISPSRFIAEIGRLEVLPDSPARIIIDERTGTIVISRNVKVSRVAVTHGNLTVRVTETPSVSQPKPFSKGETVVTTETSVKAGQGTGNFAVVDGVDLQTLVTGLNRMGLKPPGIIAILQAIKTAGALQAELVVQ